MVYLRKTEGEAVPDRSIELNANSPMPLTVLPVNYLDAESRCEWYYSAAALELREQLSGVGLPVSRLELPGEQPSVELMESYLPPWVPPVLVIAQQWLLSVQPSVIDILVGVVSNWLYDGLSLYRKAPIHALTIQKVQGSSATYTRIHYCGENVEVVRDAIRMALEASESNEADTDSAR